MNLVTLEQVSKQYSERVLLDEVDLMINTGDRIGLIGRNGSGKTTLLRIVAGEESADGGTVTVWGNVRIQYLSQNPPLDLELTVLDTVFQSDSPQMRLLRDYERAQVNLQKYPTDAKAQAQFITISAQMDTNDGWLAETNAKTVLTKLGITDFEATIGTLSGGQQKRVAMARALLDPADLLILDEPTNHIDADTIAWLEKYLQTAPNALLMVTHDRYFLDRVANQIIELDRRALVKYVGNYQQYLETREQRHEMLVKKEEKRQAFLRRELEWLRRSPMARGTKQKARIQRVAEISTLGYDRNDQRVALALASRRLGTRVISAENLSVYFDGAMLFENVDFQLERGDRIGIVGPNGAGKSTLLNLLAGKLKSSTGKIEIGDTVVLGYYDQQAENLQDDLRVVEFIARELPLIQTKDGERIEAAQMLEWFLFTRKEQQSRIGSLSGGERRRLYLLSILMHQPNVLFLDEPTNDLDIQTLQVVEQFLDNFGGCLVTVSHDRYFLDRNVDFIYLFDDGKIGSRYPSPWRPEEGQHASISSEQKPAPVATSEPPLPIGDQPVAAKKLSWKERKEFEKLEADIERFEQKKDAIEAAMNAAGGDYIKIGELSAELNHLLANLDEAELRWLELSERA
jgi:ATP-binding cassette subfamily F protein uup